MSERVLARYEGGAANGEDVEGLAASAESRALSLEFRGSARVYFRIWIVNLFLTLITFGLFSAWAKVRKKRYLYSHTVLDGTPFQYLASPVPIFKGRLIAAGLALAYYACSHWFIGAMPYVLAIAGVMGPWAIARSAAFNARYSAWRNLTFGFSGSYPGAAVAFYAWGSMLILAAITLWGDNALRGTKNLTVFGVAAAVFCLSFPLWIRGIKAFVVNHTSFGGVRARFGATRKEYFGAYLSSVLPVALLGFLLATLVVVFSEQIVTKKELDSTALTWTISACVYAIYVAIFAWIQARTGNLAWGKTHVGPIRFESTLRGRDLLALYLTNALAILLSLGLLIPWAVVRTLRYRARRLRPVLEGDFGPFVGTGLPAVRAAGAEMGEFFATDFSL